MKYNLLRFSGFDVTPKLRSRSSEAFMKKNKQTNFKPVSSYDTMENAFCTVNIRQS